MPAAQALWVTSIRCGTVVVGPRGMGHCLGHDAHVASPSDELSPLLQWFRGGDSSWGQKAAKAGERSTGRLRFSGIGPQVTEQQVRDFFGRFYSTVTEVTIFRSGSRSTGSGLVVFRFAGERDKAVAELQGRELLGYFPTPPLVPALLACPPTPASPCCDRPPSHLVRPFSVYFMLYTAPRRVRPTMPPMRWHNPRALSDELPGGVAVHGWALPPCSPPSPRLVAGARVGGCAVGTPSLS